MDTTQCGIGIGRKLNRNRTQGRQPTDCQRDKSHVAPHISHLEGRPAREALGEEATGRCWVLLPSLGTEASPPVPDSGAGAAMLDTSVGVTIVAHMARIDCTQGQMASGSQWQAAAVCGDIGGWCTCTSSK